MILEVADIRIQPGQQTAFEAAAQRGLTTIFPRAKGFRGHEIRQSVESPERYLLLLQWDTVDDHAVTFRGSDLYPEWRAIVGGFFAQPPSVEHFEMKARSEGMAGTVWW